MAELSDALSASDEPQEENEVSENETTLWDRAKKSRIAGASCLRAKQYSEALAHFCAAGKVCPKIVPKIRSEFLVAFNEVIEPMERLAQFDQIFTCFEEVLKVFPTIRELPHKLGCLLYRNGDFKTALNYFNAALDIDDDFCPAALCRENVHNLLVERWHFRMLNDQERNAKYAHAIARAVEEGFDTVLDIGTGTGILSMFAAQSGAKRVNACEASETMHSICSKVLSDNHFKSKVSLINKMSNDIKIPGDLLLKERISLVVTEIFDAGLFGEGVLNALRHAWKKILYQPCDNSVKDCFNNGLVIPSHAEVYFCFIESVHIRRQYCLLPNKLKYMEVNSNVFVSELSEPYSSEYLWKMPGGYRPLSKPTHLLNANFNSLKSIMSLIEGKEFADVVDCDANGILDAVALWFEVHLDDIISLSTSPESRVCWEQAIFPTRKKMVVQAGSKVSLTFRCEGHLTLEDISTDETEEDEADEHESVPVAIHPGWMSRLNDIIFCRSLEASVVNAVTTHKKIRILDISRFPLGGILASRMDAEVVTFTDKMACEEVPKLCRALKLETDLFKYSTIDGVANGDVMYDLLIFEPMDRSGILDSNSLQDLILLKSTCLSPACWFLPRQLSLQACIVESESILRQCRMLDDSTVGGFKIAEHINKYQTNLHQGFYLSAEKFRALTNTFTVLHFDFPSSSVGNLRNRIEDMSIQVYSSGFADALVFWGRLNYFVEDVETRDSEVTSSWQQAAFITPEPRKEILAEQPVTVRCSLQHGTFAMKIKT